MTGSGGGRSPARRTPTPTCSAPRSTTRAELPPAELARLMAPTAEPLGIRCAQPVNSGPQHHYVAQAALMHLDRWARGGPAPPGRAPAGERPPGRPDAAGHRRGRHRPRRHQDRLGRRAGRRAVRPRPGRRRGPGHAPRDHARVRRAPSSRAATPAGAAEYAAGVPRRHVARGGRGLPAARRTWTRSSPWPPRPTRPRCPDSSRCRGRRAP